MAFPAAENIMAAFKESDISAICELRMLSYCKAISFCFFFISLYGSKLPVIDFTLKWTRWAISGGEAWGDTFDRIERTEFKTFLRIPSFWVTIRAASNACLKKHGKQSRFVLIK